MPFSLNWQHQLCKNPRPNPDIKTLFTDHSCAAPTNGARAPPPTNGPLVGSIPKSAGFPPMGAHAVSIITSRPFNLSWLLIAYTGSMLQPHQWGSSCCKPWQQSRFRQQWRSCIDNVMVVLALVLALVLVLVLAIIWLNDACLYFTHLDWDLNCWDEMVMLLNVLMPDHLDIIYM